MADTWRLGNPYGVKQGRLDHTITLYTQRSMRESFDSAVKSQAKVLVEWLEEYCTEHWDMPFIGVQRFDCHDCMAALHKELEDNLGLEE